ncbi:MAG: heavy-metal-associated domain-containing protein [Ktedonobacterales bacterium]|nr:heavy-metal-associated domain-containing protein [Ktedonobacterales bacterium]
MAQPQTITLAVPDVSCEHCVKTVSGALNEQPSVQDVNVDLDTKTVSFAYDPQQVSLDTLEAVLDEAGYTVAK